MTRIFYAIFFLNQKIQAHLDAIKYFSDPSQKTPAHITVRGPYTRRIEIRAANQFIRGTWLSVFGPGKFFHESQSTVFLQAGFQQLHSIWHKPDFGFRPHITLYDGKSREFSEDLLEVLKKHKLYFGCRITELKELRSYKGQSNFHILMNLRPSLLSHLVSDDTIKNAEAISEHERLTIVDSLCEALMNLARCNKPQEV